MSRALPYLQARNSAHKTCFVFASLAGHKSTTLLTRPSPRGVMHSTALPYAASAARPRPDGRQFVMGAMTVHAISPGPARRVLPTARVAPEKPAC